MKIDKYFATPVVVNDKQRVLDLFNQTEHHSPSLISRRSFCSLTGFSLIGLLLPGCTPTNTEVDIKTLSQEIEFSQFFDIIFPASALGLIKYSEAALKRIQRLPNEQLLDVVQLYKRFKTGLWFKRYLGTKKYTRLLGEACLVDLLQSIHQEQYNHALDTVYNEISKDNQLIAELWGRPFSLTDKKCVYWGTYDQAVN